MTTTPALHENYRQLLRFCALAAFFVHLAFIPVFGGNGVLWLAAINVGSVLAHAYAYWLARPNGNARLAADVIGLEVGLHAIAATVAIGWESGFHYLMIPMVPVCMLSTTRPRHKRLLIALTTALVYMGLKLWSHHHAPLFVLPNALMEVLEFGCLATLFVSFVTIAARYYEIIVKAHDTLARDAFTDPLTGALNRRRLNQLASQVAAGKQPSALLLCDLDHFKQVNDRYGHEAGDLALQAFYQQLQACTRSGDHVCRWGGEEFLVLLPHTDLATARQAAHRLRAMVEDTPIPLPQGAPLRLTVTVGLTPWHAGEALQTAVQRADAALYRGKAAGRNQVQDSTLDAPPASMLSNAA